MYIKCINTSKLNRQCDWLWIFPTLKQTRPTDATTTILRHIILSLSELCPPQLIRWTELLISLQRMV